MSFALPKTGLPTPLAKRRNHNSSGSIPRRTFTRGIALAASAALSLSLAACTTAAESETPLEGTGASGEWPRTVTHEAGETTIDAMPERIVSTTLSVTGTLLAIDAPVTATAFTPAKGGTADENGFFTQWADVAVQRNVEPLYPVGEFDLEAVIAQEPDLIVVSTSGNDSVLDQYETLSGIAPTVVVNYGDQSWQDLAEELGEATGHEQDAADVVEEFDAKVAETAETLRIEEGATASIVSYNPGRPSPVGKTTGPHAQLLQTLGFRIAEPDEQYDTSVQKREDFSFSSYEGLAESVTGSYTFLISADEKKVDAFTADPTLANVPAVVNNKVYPLGLASFRLDYYSSTEIVDWFGETFGK
ncbi:Fe2+-enterobactin ABC transporter substrate-binding protein [Arthrobacter zhangbolii]|uniref:Fe2+-enterobactin ABC transporter substrate-binding protein n=1 Tax=Arthrobacter zhangbolii TaxID=2886936 RepID=A0A9X1SAJ0_9MICC|nr:Fe2+-enterobactin ABC transporter substrate-binding protein [Arthrobacter zhangbolii]MCC3271874.1 Fe2+-enterobactin ABC transporter substrate-binding protein [Arthrobacter zhangbolii]MCC3293780.1 Fe2+-enterobactin ABC transporter substrate-binding protein [Arthrobacter zhangbolii]UON93302.1 Fe2+-enterobactin ABC transporter substrate-binding protein [Arthrobacter zhangbolii]